MKAAWKVIAGIALMALAHRGLGALLLGPLVAWFRRRSRAKALPEASSGE